MPSLSVVIAPLLGIVRAVWPSIRQLYGERRAGQAPLRSTDLLDSILDRGLAHISQDTGVDEEWWRVFLATIVHEYITPDFLRIPAVQEWLAQAQVKDDIKTIARSRILGSPVDDREVVDRLAQAYSIATGEAPNLASGPIEVIVAIVSASVLGRLSTEGQVLGGMMQAGTQAIQEQMAALAERVSDIAVPGQATPVLDEKANSDLRRIKRRRGIDPDSVRVQMEELALRVQQGELQGVSIGVRAEVLYWAARLHAVDLKYISVAQAYRDEVRRLVPGYDLRLIDGLLAKARGDSHKSLRIARELDTPDGRSVLFGLLCDVSGRAAALSWLMDRLPSGPEVFTGYGWRAAIVALAQDNRWEEAARIASGTTSGHLDECPDLAYVEGVINAGLLLPTDYRHLVFQGPVAFPGGVAEGREADERRERAARQFDVAARLMEEVGVPERAQGAREWMLWLRLTHGAQAVREAAREEVRLAMRNGREAVGRVALAIAFDVDFDPEPLQRYLRERALTGGLDEREVLAKFRMIEAKGSRPDLIRFIEQEKQTLIRVIPPDVVIGGMVEALVQQGEVTRAERTLDENVTVFDSDDLQRLRSLILRTKGEPVRRQLEELYARTEDLVDLRNLLKYVIANRDWSAALPLLEALFRHEHTVENAYHLVQAMEQGAERDDGAILKFLESNDDLVARSQDLQALKAWGLFRLGRLKESKALNDVLLRDRRSSNDLALDINIAVRSGDWEHFGTIVEREWPLRDTHDPKALLRLAAIAAENGDVARAIELVGLAAVKAPDQADVLTAAYTLSVQLGRESREVAAWLERAAALSSAEGPIHRFQIRELVEEFMPAQTERMRKVNELVTQGAVPLHAAAALLNTPLARLLIDLPLKNLQVQDGRRLTVIPIVSGARGALPTDSRWALGIDITSIMVLSNIGLLEKALSGFRSVILPPSTLEYLLNERRDARFHQPSRIAEANALHGLLGLQRLKVLEPGAVPPVGAGLTEEVGLELGELLKVARQRNGFVIHPKPIYKPSTYHEQKAELGEYEGYVLSPSTLVKALWQAGVLDQHASNTALNYLQKVEPMADAAVAPRDIVEKVICLDRLAVTYLQTAGVLADVANAAPQVFVHGLLREEVHALLSESQSRNRLEQRIEEIRLVLARATSGGQAILAPQSKKAQDDEDRLLGSTTVMHFARDNSSCDAVCIDDRCANRFTRLIDEAGRSVPLLCTVDVIRHLCSEGIITRDEMFAAMHRLRRQGFVLIPTFTDELSEALRAAVVGRGTGELAESAELKAIRIALARVRSLGLVQQPLETPYLNGLRVNCLHVVLDLWRDQSVSVQEASIASEWIWKQLFPMATEWGHGSEGSEAVGAPRAVFVSQIGALLQVGALITGEKGKAFREWMASNLVDPLLPTNADVVDDMVTVVQSGIEKLVEELTDDADAV